MKNLSLNEFRDLCDELNLVCRKTDDSIVVSLEADDDFDRNVPIYFIIQKTKIQVWACVSEYGRELEREEKLEFCNMWNRAKLCPRAYLDGDGDFAVDSVQWMDEDVSKEYMKENFIKLTLSTTWQFFVSLKKQLKGQDPFKD